ncbi:hypothetical protein L211DRAFT_368055 [Terfezia boudieri ATCC MYA-4762]|uniref:Uncharacterized protein n=1 Tax=Terfezia boudieri ATCC MYA-4762 TaxID=1051890 RepID=A0A3N4LZ95_9PEZI|nr:hypothetical protein L211DRAFT_368055 [Terfezia boudieri ATCC MYA-4762]
MLPLCLLFFILTGFHGFLSKTIRNLGRRTCQNIKKHITQLGNTAVDILAVSDLFTELTRGNVTKKFIGLGECCRRHQQLPVIIPYPMSCHSWSPSEYPHEDPRWISSGLVALPVNSSRTRKWWSWIGSKGESGYEEEEEWATTEQVDRRRKKKAMIEERDDIKQCSRIDEAF